MEKPAKNKVVRACVYTRVSTEEQTRLDFSSLDAQNEHCKRYIALRKDQFWEYIKTYTDAGISGAEIDNRPALQELLRDIRAGLVDVVVIYRLDRITRSVKNFYELLDVLNKYNVSFCSTTQDIKLTTSQGRLFLNMLLAMGSYERELTSDRVKDKTLLKVERGEFLGGYIPYGYDYDYVKKELIVNKKEAKAILMMFNEFVKTESQSAVADKLNAHGYRTKKRGVRRRDGEKKELGANRFTINSITRLLQTPTYIGKMKFNDSICDAKHEPILKNITIWNKTQEILNAKKINKNSEATSNNEMLLNVNNYFLILKGLLRCGYCDCFMSTDFSGKKNPKTGDPYLYYTCTESKRKGSSHKCPIKSISARPLERLIIKAIKDLGKKAELIESAIATANKDFGVDVKGLESKQNSIKQKLQKNSLEIGNLITLFKSEGLTALTEQIKAEMETLEGDRNYLSEELAKIDRLIKDKRKRTLHSEEIIETFKRTEAVIDELNCEEQMMLLKLLIKKITIYPVNEADKERVRKKLQKNEFVATLRTKLHRVKIEFWDLFEIPISYNNGILKTESSYLSVSGGADGTRTRDLWLDRPTF